MNKPSAEALAAQQGQHPTAGTAATAVPHDFDFLLRTRTRVGILLSGASLQERRTAVNGLRDDEKWNKIKELIVSAAEVDGLAVTGAEFNWDKFIELIKILIPLILELIGGLG